MVRKKMKAKKAMLSLNKVDSSQDFVQCLESDEETNSEQEFMDLYVGPVETNSSKTSSILANMEVDNEDIHDVSGPLEEIKVCSQELLLSSAEADEEMAQCVPELPDSPPLCTQSISQRPKFKVTPKRKKMEKEKRERKKKMKPSKSDNDFQAKMKKQKKSETMSMADNEDESSSSKTKNKEGSWIQCSRVDCLKWRKLSNDIEPTTVAERWVCAMNTDESYMECTASQETCDSQDDYDVVYTPFVAGSLVWAKVTGYPWWPGMVEDDPDYNCCYETDESEVNPISYHVSFVFDKDVSRSWVSYLTIRPFSGTDNPNETNAKFKKHSKSLSKALTLARSAMGLPMEERLKKFSFRVLYKGRIGKTKDDDEKQIHSQSSMPSQDSFSFDDDEKKSNKLKKTKRPKALKVSPTNNNEKAAKSSSKHSKSQVEDGDAVVQENTESVLTTKKKRKRKILKSDDEQEKESISETDKNMKATGETPGETPDHESKKETPKKKAVEKKDLSKKTNSVEGKEDTSEGESPEDISTVEVEETNVENAIQNDGDGNTLKKKQAKKPKEKNSRKSKVGKENENVDKVENEGSVMSGKKKKKATEKENRKDTPSVENKEKASQGKPKGVQKKRKKDSKEVGTIGVNENSHEGIKKTKKKKIKKDGFKSPSVQNVSNESNSSRKTSGESEESSPKRQAEESASSSSRSKSGESDESSSRSVTGDATAVVIAEDFDDKLNDPVVEEGSKSHDEEDQNERMASEGKKTPSSTKKIKERGAGEKKKSKKTNKANFSVSSSKVKKKKTGQDNDGLNLEASDHDSTSSTVSQKKTKRDTKPLHGKKTKPVFRKFKAPVKQNRGTSTPSSTKSSMQEKGKQLKTLKKCDSENKMASDDPTSDHEDNYVSIETLEKDINNLYHELSESETSSGLLQGADNEDEGDVTIEFFNDELTLNVGRSDDVLRKLTNSPEF